MIDFKQNIEQVEQMIFNFILQPDIDEVLSKPKEGNYLTRGEQFIMLKSSFFNNPALREAYATAKQYHQEFDKMPTPSEIKKLLELNGSDLEKDEIDAMFQFRLTDYNYAFIYKYFKALVLLRNMNITVIDILSYLRTVDVDPENINEITEKVRNELSTKLSLNFESGEDGLNFKNPVHHTQVAKDGAPTGFKFFDKTQGGGWNPKTLIMFQGRPKVGKSTVLGSIACEGFLSGLNVGVATLELSDSKYMKRIGANILEIPTEEYNKFTDETALKLVDEKLKELKESGHKTGELYIKEYPTGTASAIDIENYFLRKQEQLGKKFDLIVVDYLNLCRPIKDSESNLYQNIKKISEELRAVAVRNGWTIVSATQIKREMVDNYDFGMEAVAESFGLVHTVDGLYGLMREPMSNEMKIKVIANRDNGYEESYMIFKIDYRFMKLQQQLGEGYEYYSDDDMVSEMEEKVKESYKRYKQTSEQPEAATQEKTDSEEEPSADKSVENTEPSQQEIDYDSLLDEI